MGGKESDYFQHFRQLMAKGIIALQKEYRKIVILIAMMLNVNKNLPCFIAEDKIIFELEERLFPIVNKGVRKTVPMKEEEAEQFIDRYKIELTTRLIVESSGSLRTKVYDLFQFYSQGIN